MATYETGPKSMACDPLPTLRVKSTETTHHFSPHPSSPPPFPSLRSPVPHSPNPPSPASPPTPTQLLSSPVNTLPLGLHTSAPRQLMLVTTHSDGKVRMAEGSACIVLSCGTLGIQEPRGTMSSLGVMKGTDYNTDAVITGSCIPQWLDWDDKVNDDWLKRYRK